MQLHLKYLPIFSYSTKMVHVFSLLVLPILTAARLSSSTKKLLDHLESELDDALLPRMLREYSYSYGPDVPTFCAPILVAEDGTGISSTVDIDGDNDNDILGSEWGDRYMTIYDYVSPTNFTKRLLVIPSATLIEIHRFVVADLDNDGDYDIIAGGLDVTADTSVIEWYETVPKSSLNFYILRDLIFFFLTVVSCVRS